ncbi:hypothetical protein TNCV_1046961 [Trichonephila clavipes]|nr:hypothetical protein TNCV_1046961 [Trichonephila clavipes]
MHECVIWNLNDFSGLSQVLPDFNPRQEGNNDMWMLKDFRLKKKTHDELSDSCVTPCLLSASQPHSTIPITNQEAPSLHPGPATVISSH